MTTPSLFVVTLNWNSYEDTEKCISSLREQQYSSIRIILVDNGSNDESGHRLKNKFDDITVLFNDENLGFSRGCNRGIQYALDQGADYILLLNNDVRLRTGTIKRLMKTAEENEKTLVGGVIFHEDSNDIWYAGGTLYSSRGTSEPWRTVKHENPYLTEFLPGAFICVPRAFFEEHGLLDEAYFFGQEDREIALWAQDNNWDLLVDPEMEMDHNVASTAGKENSFRAYHEMYNRIIFARKELSLLNQLLFVIHFTYSALSKFIMWSIEGRRELVYGLMLSIYDGMTNVFPRKPAFFC